VLAKPISRTQEFWLTVTNSCQNGGTTKMPAQELTNEIINAAILGFEEQKRKIDSQIADLRASLTGEPAPTTAEPAKVPHRRISAAARKRMAAAQRKRWAAVKGEVAEPVKKISKSKRKLSAAGRAAIVAALKKRWADKKAATKK
jgi:hypothetical protein